MSKNRPAKSGTVKRSHHKKKTAGPVPLPEPVAVASVQAGSVESAQPVDGGLLGGLGAFLSGGNSQPAPEPGISSTGSLDGSLPDGELSPEVEEILRGVPDVIGGEADDAGGPADLAGTPGESFGVGDEICDAEAARALLAWVGDSLADWRKREEYRIAGQRAGAAAPHWARVVNNMWARYAPAFLAGLGSSCPGLIPALTITAVAFGPAAMADIKATGRERAARGIVEPARGPVAVPQPEPERVRPARGIVFEG